MKRVIHIEKDFSEGMVFNRYLESKMIRKNKNNLTAITGPTGSGKSYASLRIAELWYNYHFNKPFPIENVCFSIKEVMMKLSSKKLKRGEILIIEEGGVLLNSLEFQNKVSKMFSYTLQSFRSMNLCLIINLPVLTMLNKSARLLLHNHFITFTIDHEKKLCKLKLFFHQLNQQSGKVYPKYMRVRVGGKARTIKRINYGLPQQDLIEEYEKKKFRFVENLNETFVKEIEQQESETDRKLSRNNLTATQQEVYDYVKQGLNVKEIAELRGVADNSIYEIIKGIKKRGFNVKIEKNTREIKEN